MNNFHPRNVLVTGGAGFIGSHFVRYFLSEHPDIKLINLDKLTYAGSLDNLADVANKEQYHFIHGDICDRKLIDHILETENIDTIIHFAAESHVDRSITGPAAFIETNIVGTFTLLEAARQYWLEKNKMGQFDCRFHHVSTDEVYGSLTKEDAPFHESHPYEPNSPYSASKASSDHLVRAYYKTYDLPICVSNCSNNYGPFQHNEKLIPTVIRACKNWQPIPVYGDGTNVRDWLYVVDHCRAIDLIIYQGMPGETYNVGGNNEQSNWEIVSKICALMNDLKPTNEKYESLITFVKDRPGHDWRYAIDSTKIALQLGFTISNSFEENLLTTIKWYLSH